MVSKQIRLKSRAARYRTEAHLELLGWRPVKVAPYGVYSQGYGVRHADTKMLTYRAGADHYIFDCPRPETMTDATEVNWCQLPSGLFWTIVDWFERKGCWDGYEPDTGIHGSAPRAPWLGASAAEL